MDFKQYRRTGLSEMRQLTEQETGWLDLSDQQISVSAADRALANDSPEEFEMGFVARNPTNHDDQWYVSRKYFEENLEEITQDAEGLVGEPEQQVIEHLVDEPLLKLFRYDHLPKHLQEVSRPFSHLADVIAYRVPRSAERTLALRALWESKNLAVVSLT